MGLTPEHGDAGGEMSVCRALRNQQVVDFVRASVKAGYDELFPTMLEQVDRMVDDAFGRLALSQRDAVDPPKLVEVTAALLEDTFRKRDSSHWFNAAYHRYKTRTKPDLDFQQLNHLIPGRSVLDYGCCSGCLAARLARGGYTVLTTDVLDYRYADAKHLPFVRMSSATDIRYADDSIDTALLKAVLHHIDPGDLPLVIQRLGRIARHLLIQEDTYDVTGDLDG